MNILILGTCSSKKNSVSSPTPAYEVYEGPQHQYLVKAWGKLKNALGGGHKVDYYIISAKYGLINSSKRITPYNITFADKTKEEIKEMSSKLKIDDKLINLLPKYDIVFWTLSDSYMEAITETLQELKDLGNTTNIFFIPPSFLDDFPEINDEDYIILKDKDTKKYRAGKVMLKGKYFLILADILTKEVNTIKALSRIQRDPQYIEDLINKYWKRNRVLEYYENDYSIKWIKI